MRNLFFRTGQVVVVAGALLFATPGRCADTNVYLLDMPDYEWEWGCFGTATGNLFGFWDRNGLPNLYTGLAGGGVAPLNSSGGNYGIRSLWASRAGVDGRPAGNPGHVDDYYAGYESTSSDPYVSLGRPEHSPDCIGDFIGLNQKKWTNMNNECDGNIDGYSFVYWDKIGNRRVNYQPTNALGEAVPDIQSGLGAWTKHRGYTAEVFTQLTDFNPTLKAGKGFTFEDLRHEIDSGYPVLLFLQGFTDYSRAIGGMAKGNPSIHGMLAYGYQANEFGVKMVTYRTSWAVGPRESDWETNMWQAGMPVRGVIAYHPKPKVTKLERSGNAVTIRWDGPSARLKDAITGTTNLVHRYVVEMSAALNPPSFYAVSSPLTTREFTYNIPCSCAQMAFFRVQLLPP